MESFLRDIFWWVIRVDYLLLVGLLLAILLLYTRWWRRGRTIFGVVSFFLFFIVLLPFDRWAVEFLENRFESVQEVPKDVVGIILLGGSFDTEISQARGTVTYNRAAGRILKFIELGNRYPYLRLLFTGGAVTPGSQNESQLAKKLFDKVDFNDRRVVYEDKSKNTYENAVFSYDLIKPNPKQRWLLVTSAYHMPRAVGLFRRAGWNVVPCPVDYRTPGTFAFNLEFFMNEGFSAWRILAHEFAGMTVNYLFGKSESWVPGLRDLAK